MASRTYSLSAPMVSTPAKPPPATTNVSMARRAAVSSVRLANSSSASIWLRSRKASPSDFIVKARSSTPGKLKKLVSEPKAMRR